MATFLRRWLALIIFTVCVAASPLNPRASVSDLICSSSPFATYTPLSNYDPAESFCSSKFPPLPCTSSTSTATAINPVVMTVHTTVATVMPTSIVTLPNTMTVTITITSSTVTVFTTTATTTVTVTASPTTSTSTSTSTTTKTQTNTATTVSVTKTTTTTTVTVSTVPPMTKKAKRVPSSAPPTPAIDQSLSLISGPAPVTTVVTLVASSPAIITTTAKPPVIMRRGAVCTSKRTTTTTTATGPDGLFSSLLSQSSSIVSTVCHCIESTSTCGTVTTTVTSSPTMTSYSSITATVTTVVTVTSSPAPITTISVNQTITSSVQATSTTTTTPTISTTTTKTVTATTFTASTSTSISTSTITSTSTSTVAAKSTATCSVQTSCQGGLQYEFYCNEYITDTSNAGENIYYYVSDYVACAQKCRFGGNYPCNAFNFNTLNGECDTLINARGGTFHTDGDGPYYVYGRYNGNSC